MTINYQPKGTCSQQMTIEVEDGIVRSFQVKRGCHGNMQWISRLVENAKMNL